MWRNSTGRPRFAASLRGMTNLARILALLPEAFTAVDAAFAHSQAKSLESLRSQVRKWRDERHPHLSDRECERLVGCLNRNFYALEEA